jgi:hypothetical protein
LYSLAKFCQSLAYKATHSTRIIKNKLLGRDISDDRSKHPYRKRLSVPCKVDLLQGLLIILVCVFLHHVTDASRMYHSVRGQVSHWTHLLFSLS